MKRALLLVSLLMLFSGCQAAYFGAMEKFGYHKRDILSSRVEGARDSQEDAKEQFKTALERFESVVAFDGGDLEEKYNKLNNELIRSETSAKVVRDRIDSVETVGDHLFDEWQDELDQYSSASLRQNSERKLRDTQQQYGRLLQAMRAAERKIDPVLIAFRDQVLFLKHNLNARAISALQGETVKIESDVARLVREMERSIQEANKFISTLES